LPDAPAVTFKQGTQVLPDLDFEAVTHPATKTLKVDIENTGKGTLRSPIVSLEGAGFEIAVNNFAGITELRPGEVKSVDIRFTPPADGVAGTRYTGMLSVVGSNLAAPAKLDIKGAG